LRTVDNQIDTTTGTIRLRAVFDNRDDSLFPNQFVNINLNLSTLRAATVVPAATIQRASFGTFVYVIKPDGKATIRKVVLGAAEGDRVAITEGVAPGERVVLEGVDALQEGTTVEIVGGGAPTGAAGGPTGSPTGARTGARPGTPAGAPASGPPSTPGAAPRPAPAAPTTPDAAAARPKAARP
jgi:multidrug efflux system membrane fusion protein